MEESRRKTEGGPGLRRVAYLDSSHFDWHEGPGYHPETPKRLIAIRQLLQKQEFEPKLLRPEFGEVDDALLGRVHDEKYLAELRRLAAFGGGNLDADTYVTGQSYEVALLAAGAVQRAAQGVALGEFDRAFCSVRPPGHHATRERGMGFCLLNNVVVGAYAVLGLPGIARVAILDWDVHHGNGTEQITYERQDVFYASIHQFPAYPYTGEESARGRGAGMNCNLNVALPPEAGSEDMLAAWENVIRPAWEDYQPDLVLISAGFDADARDPLASLAVTTRGFVDLTARVVSFADEFCSGRIVSVLEGGYNLSALAEDVCAHLEGLL